jgi:hypothetical protein
MLLNMNGNAGHNLSMSVDGEASSSCLRQCDGAQQTSSVQVYIQLFIQDC